MSTSNTVPEQPEELPPHKEPNRIAVLADEELDEAVSTAAKILRMGKGSFLRLAGIEKLIEMGIWNPKQKRKR